MGLHRFFVARLTTGDIELDEAESSHASRVLRLRSGDDVLLFDGRGNEGFGAIRSIDRRRVVVNVASTRFAPRDHDGRLALAVAMPKGDRQRNVIEKLVELGVDFLIPIETERSIAQVDGDAAVRLARYVVEACKQSGRNRLLQILPSVPWGEFILDPSWGSHERWILHPCVGGVKADDLLFSRSGFERGLGQPLLFAIGPEGGFADEEVKMTPPLGFRTLDLGERILRVETAVAYVSVLGHWLTLTHPDDSQGLR